MKMKMKRIVIAFVFTFLIMSFCGLSSSAQQVDIKEILQDQSESSGAADLPSQLTDDAKEFLEDIDIVGADAESIVGLKIQNIFITIFDFFKSKGKRPFIAALGVIGVVLAASVAQSFLLTERATDTLLGYVCTLGVISALIIPAMGTITSVAAAIKGCSVFMLAFIPVFCGILLTSGKIATSAGAGALLITACEFVSQISSFVIMPIVGMHLALGVSSAAAPELSGESIANVFKKVATWMMTLTTTIFIGVMGMQSIITGATDSVSLRTAKFVVTSAVPVVGSAVGEAIGAVKSCISVLSGAVGMYGVIAVAAIFIPVMIELLLWRLSIAATVAVCDILNQQRLSILLKAVDTTISFLIAIIICITMIFTISLTVVTAVGGKVS